MINLFQEFIENERNVYDNPQHTIFLLKTTEAKKINNLPRMHAIRSLYSLAKLSNCKHFVFCKFLQIQISINSGT